MSDLPKIYRCVHCREMRHLSDALSRALARRQARLAAVKRIHLPPRDSLDEQSAEFDQA